MEDSAKYLVHADVTADGVVERSDVVGAVFGQTEGLLGSEMDLRTLQEASKVGRIDVDVDSEGGRSFGEITIASSLDKVETAVLAASLETIDRVGPCRSEVRITGIEDVRAARRRQVVDRAKELVSEGFDESAMTTHDILEEVRGSIRVEDITEYEGMPAGPNVGDSDAIIVVEGRADVLQLLKYGIKNAVAVEGTSVPDAIGDLTADRTVTAFLDGDRGGDLILKELDQIGDIDYVALAPPGRSVEDLSRHEVTNALREKVPYDVLSEGDLEVAATDGSLRPAPDSDGDQGGPPDADPGTADGPTASAESGAVGGPTPGSDHRRSGDPATGTDADAVPADAGAGATAEASQSGHATADSVPDGPSEPSDAGRGPEATGSSTSADEGAESVSESGTGVEPEAGAGEDETADEPRSLRGHVDDVVGADADTVRLLDDTYRVLADAPADEAFETIESVEEAPWAVVLDGELPQRVLDVAAQRGVAQVVARTLGEFVKRPTSVRIRTADQLEE